MKRVAFLAVLGLSVQLVMAQNVVEPTKKTEPQKGSAVAPAPPTKTGTATPAGEKKVEPAKGKTETATEKVVAPPQDKKGTAVPTDKKEPVKTATESVVPQPEKKGEGSATVVAPKPEVKNEPTATVEVAVPAKPAIPAATPGAPATLSAEKTYTIINYNGMSLEALNGGDKASNVVASAAKADAVTQKWRLIPAGDNFYYIFNEAQRYSLDIEGRVDQNGKNIRVWVPNGSNAQKFKLIPIGNDQYWIQTNNGNNLGIDGATSGANVLLRTSGQDINQRWVIK
jgi:outer membrane biosynthesis protein TonB